MADTEATSVFDMEPDEAHEARLDAEAMADFEAGRFVPHERVAEWLSSWGTGRNLPPPRPDKR